MPTQTFSIRRYLVLSYDGQMERPDCKALEQIHISSPNEHTTASSQMRKNPDEKSR